MSGVDGLAWFTLAAAALLVLTAALLWWGNLKGASRAAYVLGWLLILSALVLILGRVLIVALLAIP